MSGQSPDYATLQAVRLSQLQAMAPEVMDGLLRRMTGADKLPAMKYHFERHGRDFGAAAPEDYEKLFLDHIGRADLRYFTSIHPKFGTKMWHLVAMDNGCVAQYNESRQAYWSFYAVTTIGRFLRYGRGWWIEVRRTESGWEFDEWA